MYKYKYNIYTIFFIVLESLAQTDSGSVRKGVWILSISTFVKKVLDGGGVKVPHHKETQFFPTEVMPVPAQIILPMSQHIGAPCEPVVKKGDKVYVGTMVGKGPVPLSMNIYSSASGVVNSVKPVLYNTGKMVMTVTIDTDGQQDIDPNIAPPDVHDLDSFTAAVSESGIVGLGGAGFPTDIKIVPKNLVDIDTLLINGAECEPYLSTDNREMLECPEDVLFGIEQTLKYLGIPKAMICIEKNKPKAIELLTKLTADNDRISVKSLPSKYPQGAQNILIKNATGRVVPRGARHTSVGVLMLNVTTVSSIGKYIKTGIPLVTKRMTVAGDAVSHWKNLDVLIGTPMIDVLRYCGIEEQPGKVITGGPMMGAAQKDVTYPITRQNNGLLALSTRCSVNREAGACIRCGRCVRSCPMGLSPVDIENAYEKYDADKLMDLMADLCIGCGTCSYVCPAKRPLTQSNVLASKYTKSKLKGAKK